jgi:hypothetical protein
VPSAEYHWPPIVSSTPLRKKVSVTVSPARLALVVALRSQNDGPPVAPLGFVGPTVFVPSESVAQMKSAASSLNVARCQSPPAQPLPEAASSAPAIALMSAVAEARFFQRSAVPSRPLSFQRARLSLRSAALVGCVSLPKSASFWPENSTGFWLPDCTGTETLAAPFERRTRRWVSVPTCT